MRHRVDLVRGGSVAGVPGDDEVQQLLAGDGVVAVDLSGPSDEGLQSAVGDGRGLEDHPACPGDERGELDEFRGGGGDHCAGGQVQLVDRGRGLHHDGGVTDAVQPKPRDG